MTYFRKCKCQTQLPLELAAAGSVLESATLGLVDVSDPSVNALVIFNGKQLFNFNASAAILWELMSDPFSIDGLESSASRHLGGKYVLDAKSFVERLLIDGLIEKAS